MILRKWDKLPDELRVPEVRPYYDVLSRRRASLALKRLFDCVVSLVLLLALFPVMLVIAAAIRLEVGIGTSSILTSSLGDRLL